MLWNVLEKTLESPLGSKEIKPVTPKRNQHWIFVGRTDAEAEAPTLWPPDVKNQLIRKDPYAGKDWRREGVKEDEMVGWHHQFSGLEFEQTPGDSEDREAVLLPSTQLQRVGHDLATEQQQRYACLWVCVQSWRTRYKISLWHLRGIYRDSQFSRLGRKISLNL